MSRVLLSGFRLRIGDSNYLPADVNGLPYRLRFYDSTTTDPKLVYSGPEDSDVTLGSIVDLDAEGYVPTSGIWLDTGKYNIHVQYALTSNPVDDEDDWGDLWNINKVQGGEEVTSGSDASEINFYDTINELRLLEGDALDGVALLNGYYEINDGGQGKFRWYENSTKSDDGGAYIKPTTYSTSQAGRWHRIFDDYSYVPVSYWGVLPDVDDCSSNFTLAKNWAKRTADQTAITLVFTAGDINFGGDITLDGGIDITGTGTYRYIQYIIENNCKFIFSTIGSTLYFVNPVEIKTRSQLTNSKTIIDFGTKAVEYIRPEWYGSEDAYINKIARASTFGIPVYINPLDSIDWDDTSSASYNITSDLHFFGDNKLSIPSSVSVSISGDIYTSIIDHPVFTSSAGEALEGELKIDTNEIRASWFGYGTAGVDQGPFVQKAFDTYPDRFLNQTGATIIFDQIDFDLAIETDIATDYSRKIKVDGVIKMTDGATLSSITLVDEKATHIFDIEEDCNITISNTQVKPEWFGGDVLNYDGRTIALANAIRCAEHSGIPLDGSGKTFTITSQITLVSFTSNLTIRNLTISTISTFLDTYTLALSTTGNLILSNINIIHNGGSNNVKSVALSGNDVNITNCNFENEFEMTGTNMNFTNNVCTGITTSTSANSQDSYFLPSTSEDGNGMIISNNIFNDTKVFIGSEIATVTPNSFPMLKNVIFTDNVLNTNGEEYSGCVTLLARGTNTVVSGLLINNNTFSGQVVGNGDTSGIDARRRIRNEYSDGTWLNRSISDSSEPYYKIGHTMIVKDNTASYLFDSDSTDTSATREQIIPTTDGVVYWDQTTTGDLQLNADGFQSFIFDPEVDDTIMFLLEGDDETKFNEYKLSDSTMSIYISPTTTKYGVTIASGVPKYESINDLKTNTYNGMRGAVDNVGGTLTAGTVYGNIKFKLYQRT